MQAFLTPREMLQLSELNPAAWHSVDEHAQAPWCFAFESGREVYAYLCFQGLWDCSRPPRSSQPRVFAADVLRVARHVAAPSESPANASGMCIVYVLREGERCIN